MSRRIIAASAMTAAGAMAALSVFSDKLDAGAADASISSPADSAGGARQSLAYRRAFLGGIPPKLDFVEHFSVALFARGMARGDFNGDGRDDLAVMGGAPEDEERAARIYLYLQTEAGTFSAPELIEVPRVVLGFEVASLAAGDLNEDGKDDLVVASWAEGVGLMTMLSAAGGEYRWREDAWNDGVPGQAPPQLADQDGDGHLDVILSLTDRDRDYHDPESSQLATWFGDGQGGFSRHAAIESEHNDPSLTLGQFDGAGPLDLLVISGSYPPPMLLRAGAAGAWLPPSPLPALEGGGNLTPGNFVSGSAFDLNGDGRDDAVLSVDGPRPQLGVHLQQADGTLSPQRVLLTGGTLGFLDRPVDLDGNGLKDLVQVGYSTSQTAFIYLLQDAYGLDYAVEQTVVNPAFGDYSPSAIAIGDFNGDGTADVAISSRRDGVRVWRGRLTPYLGDGALPGTPTVLQAEADPDPMKGMATVTLAAAATDGGAPVTGYTVYANPGGGIDADAGSLALVHRMTGLTPGKQYSFRARASNAAGKGPPSTYAAAVTMPSFQPEINLNTGGLVEEPDFGDATVTIWPSLDLPAPPGGTSFVLSTQDGSAHAGSDYEALSPTLVTIPAGQYSASPVEITVHGDLDIEGNESFKVLASNVVGAHWPTEVAVTLQEYDADALRFGYRFLQPVEGDSGKSRVQIPVLLPAPAATDVVVYLAAQAPWWGGTQGATEGVDFELPVSQVVIPAGQTMASVPLDIVGDAVRENGESLMVLASLNPFPVIGGPSPAIVLLQIVDNDPVPALSLSPVAVQEGDEDIVVAHFKATLSAPQPDDAWFSFETRSGSATPGADFVDTRRTGLVIRAGETELDIPVVVLGDRLAEGTEAFTGRLSGPYQVALGGAAATATILDDDASTGISVNGVSQPEGNGPGVARFVVELAAPQTTPVSFDLRTSDGTAFAGSDYGSVAMNDVVIPAGQTRMTVDVPVLGDTTPEATETFGLEITRAAGATPVRARALARLVNDDQPTISISDATVVEGTDSNSPRSMRFTVTLSSPTVQPVAYWLTVRSTGSATPFLDMGSNYQPAPIDPGRTRQSIDLDVYGDAIAEADETFEVVISIAHGATIGDGVGVGTIIDDDAPVAPVASAGRAATRPPTRAAGGRTTRLGVRPAARVGSVNQ